MVLPLLRPLLSDTLVTITGTKTAMIASRHLKP